jgi:hypothetical protein
MMRTIVTAPIVERNIVMPKYYIKCGTLELIYSTNKKPMRAAAAVLWETNKFDVLDEYFYVDERGFKDYLTAHPDTKVYKTEKIIEKAGWTME